MDANVRRFWGILLVLVLIVGVAFLLFRGKPERISPNGDTKPSQPTAQADWQYNGEKWVVTGDAPKCPYPLVIKAPIDVTRAIAVLYPGQVRGGNYKPHGGFLFNGARNEDITVRAPFDGAAVLGSRYIEQGEAQYLLFFVNPCGIAYRFDHLHTLSPAMQQAADTLPPAKPDDSRTTRFAEPITVKEGDVIATAVGFKNNANVSVDFGVYNLGELNRASGDPDFASAHTSDKEQASYAVCWIDWFDARESSIIRALPGGDQAAGKTSDYCQ